MAPDPLARMASQRIRTVARSPEVTRAGRTWSTSACTISHAGRGRAATGSKSWPSRPNRAAVQCATRQKLIFDVRWCPSRQQVVHRGPHQRPGQRRNQDGLVHSGADVAHAQFDGGVDGRWPCVPEQRRPIQHRARAEQRLDELVEVGRRVQPRRRTDSRAAGPEHGPPACVSGVPTLGERRVRAHRLKHR